LPIPFPAIDHPLNPHPTESANLNAGEWDRALPIYAAVKLRAVKLLHTVVWAVFASSIVAIPVFAWLEVWRVTLALIVLVTCECVVLLVNGMRCPLTGVAARYTDDRSANFDIYLPLWLARYNKHIFGALYAIGLVIAALRWWS
jgi:hypothetical protein